MSLLQNYRTDFILLIESGFIAVNQSDEDAALKLFKAAELLDPHNPLSHIGLGYIHLFKLELKQAEKVFAGVLHHHPDSEMAKALLGLSLSLNPQEVSQGEKVLEESATKSKDPSIKKLAVTALEFVNKFVKNAPTPTQASPAKRKRKS